MNVMIEGLALLAIILALAGLRVFIGHVWKSGLSTTLANIAGGGWALSKWVIGLVAVGTVMWLLGPLWTVVVLLVLLML